MTETQTRVYLVTLGNFTSWLHCKLMRTYWKYMNLISLQNANYACSGSFTKVIADRRRRGHPAYIYIYIYIYIEREREREILVWYKPIPQSPYNMVAFSSKLKFFWRKISQPGCVFQFRLGPEENNTPLHLVTSTGFMKAWLEYYSKYHIKISFISLAPKMLIYIIAVLVKANEMQCPLHNQKVNKPSFHGASCQLAPSNIWAHKVQYLPTAVYL